MPFMQRQSQYNHMPTASDEANGKLFKCMWVMGNCQLHHSILYKLPERRALQVYVGHGELPTSSHALPVARTRSSSSACGSWGIAHFLIQTLPVSRATSSSHFMSHDKLNQRSRRYWRLALASWPDLIRPISWRGDI